LKTGMSSTRSGEQLVSVLKRHDGRGRIHVTAIAEEFGVKPDVFLEWLDSQPEGVDSTAVRLRGGELAVTSHAVVAWAVGGTPTQARAFSDEAMLVSRALASA